jgi:antirestriction protein
MKLYITYGLSSWLEASEKYGEEEVKAYVKCFGKWNEEQFNERYCGQYDSWERMAEEYLEESGEIEPIPENLHFHFDYEKYARDMRLSGNLTEHNGYFFWNC